MSACQHVSMSACQHVSMSGVSKDVRILEGPVKIMSGFRMTGCQVNVRMPGLTQDVRMSKGQV